MNGKDQCAACSGGGMVPGPECTCGKYARTCTPVVCTACHGSGAVKA